MTMRSAVSSDGASSQPAASRRPAISSESLRFIWQPSVQTWKRGRLADIRQVLAESVVRGRLGRGAGASRAGVEDVEHRAGRGWVVRSVTAAPWYAEERPTTLCS